MATSRKSKTKNRQLIDVVFSWSLDDVLKMDLYRNKVNRIPDTFSSIASYRESFIEPLLEETHAALLARIDTIYLASTRGIIGVASEPRKFNSSKYYFYSISLERKLITSNNQKGSYEPEVGDLIALTHGRPRFLDEDKRPIRSAYFIALVQKVDDEAPDTIKVKCSKPIMFPDHQEANKGGKDVFLAVHLVNLTTNTRIWQALHCKLDGNKTKLINKVLQYDSQGIGRCSLCSIEDSKKSASPDLQEAVSSLSLNASQETAVWSCIAARECHHTETVNLIWGPPGTGKTKTIVGLLFVLWKLKCRTLTCTPTNHAAVEATARFVSLVSSSLDNETYGIGDIVLFGNPERMKIDGFQELDQVFLDNRVSILAGCLSPTSGWRSQAESMIRLLKDTKGEYDLYLQAGGRLPENTESKEEMLSFRRFTMERFNIVGEKLETMVRHLYTHMPTSFVKLQLLNKMMGAIKLIRSIRSWPKFREKKVVFLQLLEEVLCETASFPNFTDDQKIGNFCLKNASFIFCTAASSTRLHTLNTNMELLVFDEAAQLKECESLIPLQVSGLRNIILVGDQRQLPAMVQSKICERSEFGRSLFERLMVIEHKTHLLNIQYRMHPMISSFPNKQFYEEKMVDGPNVKEISYMKQFLDEDMFGSYSFIHLSHGQVEYDTTKSGRNMVEVAVILELVAKLHKVCMANGQKISVGCITPYKSQLYAIQNKLGDIYQTREARERGFTLNVGTVDGFQGCEEDVIIISTVTGTGQKSMGFLSMAQRANVALTRARHCLWILGNGDTLKRSGGIWELLVKDAQGRGCFHVGHEDKSLCQAMANGLLEVGQFDGLFDGNSLFFKGATWKVVFDDDLRADVMEPEDYNEVHSVLMKLAGGWCKGEVISQDFVPLKRSEVNCRGLSLVWNVDIMEEGSETVQVLKVWGILQDGHNLSQLMRRMNEFYMRYSHKDLDRCKEIKMRERGLEVPKTWSGGKSGSVTECINFGTGLEVPKTKTWSGGKSGSGTEWRVREKVAGSG